MFSRKILWRCITFGAVYTITKSIYVFFFHRRFRIHTVHYENTPMQYTAIFHSCKNDNFQMKNCDICSYFCSKYRSWVHVRTEAVVTSTPDLCFGAKIRKMYTPVNPSFTI